MCPYCSDVPPALLSLRCSPGFYSNRFILLHIDHAAPFQPAESWIKHEQPLTITSWSWWEGLHLSWFKPMSSEKARVWRFYRLTPDQPIRSNFLLSAQSPDVEQGLTFDLKASLKLASAGLHVLLWRLQERCVQGA